MCSSNELFLLLFLNISSFAWFDWTEWLVHFFWSTVKLITQIQQCLECRFDSGNAWHLVRSLLRLQDMDTPCVLLDSSLSLFLSFSVWSLNFELRRYIESLSSNAHICTFANVACCIHIAYILRQEDADVKLLLFCVWILINYQKKSRLIAANFIVVTNFSIIFSISEERFSAEASWDLATLT